MSCHMLLPHVMLHATATRHATSYCHTSCHMLLPNVMPHTTATHHATYYWHTSCHMLLPHVTPHATATCHATFYHQVLCPKRLLHPMLYAKSYHIMPHLSLTTLPHAVWKQHTCCMQPRCVMLYANAACHVCTRDYHVSCLLTAITFNSKIMYQSCSK